MGSSFCVNSDEILRERAVLSYRMSNVSYRTLYMKYIISNQGNAEVKI